MPSVASILALQRLAGNGAVVAMLSRRPTVQRAPHVDGQFTGQTPANGDVIPAQEFRLLESRFGADFMVNAHFQGTGGHQGCEPGEYRQYVKGYYNENGIRQEHELDDGAMTPGAWIEDRDGESKYGYRDKQRKGLSWWTPDIQGCDLSTNDTPSTPVEDDSTTYDMHLDFRGVLIDTADGNRAIETREWVVEGTRPGTGGRGQLDISEEQPPPSSGPKKKKKKGCGPKGCIVS